MHLDYYIAWAADKIYTAWLIGMWLVWRRFPQEL